MENTTKPRLRFVKTNNPPFWVKPLIPLLALLVTFIITSGLILWSKANPFEAYYYFLLAPLGNNVSILEILVKSTPLILTGVAVSFAFATGYYNIGAEGQLYAGAIAAAGLGIALHGVPAIIAIPVMLIGGFLAGMAWALIPALLKVKMAVDEVVTTLLMNSIMAYIVSALLNGPWRDPNSGWPQSPEISPTAMFFKIIPRSRLNLGFIIAIITLIVLWIILTRTSFGLKMRAVGMGKPAAQFAGISVSRTTMIAALISGGIAGIAGVAEVAGIQFHLIGELSPGYGYTGVIIATLGSLNAIGVGIAAIFFGLLDTGAQTVSRALGVPVYLGEVTQAILLLVTLGMLLLQRYRIRRM
ncbi:MAG: ABC transporter permease [Chloroflexi bacterium HGW-Chloroflexi-10]|nr:MAG: ABC transporter permease [Chloroflexi bacterium HGW-Chloroflexi-10]